MTASADPLVPRSMADVAGLKEGMPAQLLTLEEDRILPMARHFLNVAPRTITACRCPRSPGSRHDFYSEAGYWWPDPDNPAGAYIRRDGFTNPDRFDGHMRALDEFKYVTATMASAFLLTGDPQFVRHACEHLEAWFVDSETQMNPDLRHAGAVPGVDTGRQSGVIHSMRLVDVARSILILQRSAGLPQRLLSRVRSWFRRYVAWLTSHPHGRAEQLAPNNHGVSWALQVAAFSSVALTGRHMPWVRERFRACFICEKMDRGGRFPEELRRNTPYHYSILNMEFLSCLAEAASERGPALWDYETADGRGLARGAAFLAPYLQRKESWPFAIDTQTWDAPVARPVFLLLAGMRLQRPDYIDLWASLAPSKTVLNFPLIWACDL